MKRSLLTVLMIAFLVLGVSACAPQPPAQLGPTLQAPKTDAAVQADKPAKLAGATMTNVAPAGESEVTSADALKLILLQWLVAR